MPKILVLQGETVFYFHQLLFQTIKQQLATQDECLPVVKQMILQAPENPEEARTTYNIRMILEIDEELILKVGLLVDLSLIGEKGTPVGLELFKAFRRALQPIQEKGGEEDNEIPQPEWFKKASSRKARSSPTISYDARENSRENPHPQESA